MINGRFDNLSRRPFLDCFLSLHVFNISGPVEFLLDTGADSTLLMPTDASRLNIDYSKLLYGRTCYGVGGPCEEYIVPGFLIIPSPTMLYGYRFPIGVVKPDPQIPDLEECPSILGMDIIRFLRVTCDYTDHLLTVEIKMSDDETPV